MFLLSYCVFSSLFLSLICSPTLQLVYFPNAMATHFQAFLGKALCHSMIMLMIVYSIERFPTTFMRYRQQYTDTCVMG
jgi:hypothetical protein